MTPDEIPQELVDLLDERAGRYDAMKDPHRYLSTACLHGHHDYCKYERGVMGFKKPGHCKFCDAPCICDCHQTSELNSVTNR